ncbi:MAG: hypothetical protein WCJ64_01155 [Rhodospirillaceae bacterium]
MKKLLKQEGRPAFFKLNIQFAEEGRLRKIVLEATSGTNLPVKVVPILTMADVVTGDFHLTQVVIRKRTAKEMVTAVPRTLDFTNELTGGPQSYPPAG